MALGIDKIIVMSDKNIYSTHRIEIDTYIDNDKGTITDMDTGTDIVIDTDNDKDSENDTETDMDSDTELA
jgi:hypothetical protein